MSRARVTYALSATVGIAKVHHTARLGPSLSARMRPRGPRRCPGSRAGQGRKHARSLGVQHNHALVSHLPILCYDHCASASKA